MGAFRSESGILRKTADDEECERTNAFVEVKDNNPEIIKEVVCELYHFKCEDNTICELTENTCKVFLTVTARLYLNSWEGQQHVLIKVISFSVFLEYLELTVDLVRSYREGLIYCDFDDQSSFEKNHNAADYAFGLTCFWSKTWCRTVADPKPFALNNK